MEDFPGSSVVKNLPANAGDRGSISYAVGQLSHAPQLLSPCMITTEACKPRAEAPHKGSHCNEKPSHHHKQ